MRFSGCTVHFVDEGLDSGPIVRQAVVPVLDEDTAETLSARILKEEHRIYSEAIALVLSGGTGWRAAGWTYNPGRFRVGLFRKRIICLRRHYSFA